MMQSRIDRIYQEGAKLFSRNGFEGTSLRHVASACGISMAAIHYYFPTKEELHNEITQFCFEDFIEQIIAKHRKLPPGMDKPSLLLLSIFDAITLDPTLFNLMQHDMQHLNEDKRRDRSRQRYAAFVSLIGQTMRKTWGREPDETVVLCATGLIAGYCEVLQADERSSDIERDQFIQRHRAGLVRLVEMAFDRPDQY